MSMVPSKSVLICKRIADVIVGTLGSTVFLFTYPFIALLIRWDSKGPILYSQERVGMNKRAWKASRADGDTTDRRENVGGRPFVIYKFRSMRTDSESNGPQFAGKGADSRITRVGWWLRATHLDELPQFWNILKGDMSFIGPRPERAFFTLQFHKSIPHYEHRTLFIRPGLTGLAQITVGYDDSLESVIRKSYYDYTYRASLCSIRSWLKMEFWVYLNTVSYLLKPLRSSGDVRELSTLNRAKALPFLSRSLIKSGSHRTSALIKLEGGKSPVVLTGESPAEVTSILETAKATGGALEVCYTAPPHFDLEDLGYLLNLTYKVHAAGGRLSIRNSSARIRRMLKEIHMDKLVELKRSAGMVRNFLTIDVECWFHAFNLSQKVPRSTWHLQTTRLMAHMQRILNLLEAHNTKATFFVLGWVADRYPDLVEYIDSQGHEIGTHGYNHKMITEMTPEEFEEDLVQSLEAISKHCRQPVTSHRASNFTVVKNTLWALDIMSRNGITLDSSIFPIQRDRYGIPHYPNRLPHTIHLPGGRTIQEFPMSTLGVGKKFLPMSGGGYLRLFPHQVTERFVHLKNVKGQPAMVYFHPWELDTQQTRHQVGMIRGFQHYVNLHTTEWKLNRLLETFSFTSLKEAAATRRVRSFLRRNPVHLKSGISLVGGNDHRTEFVVPPIESHTGKVVDPVPSAHLGTG